jgi:hypothetical protein
LYIQHHASIVHISVNSKIGFSVYATVGVKVEGLVDVLRDIKYGVIKMGNVDDLTGREPDHSVLVSLQITFVTKVE